MKHKILFTTAMTLLLSASLAQAQYTGANKNGPMVNPYAASNLNVMGHPLQLADRTSPHTNPKEVNPWFEYVGYDSSVTIPSSIQTPSRRLP
ncbi:MULTISPECIES: hypothetical protein [Vitreoscilla]|uniref:Uncharacterized protein n=1 Tax=Vitreoscilla stercoraria TaxID=61 RepID=A0ABY4EB18_VITST|nr:MULTISPECIES: hypothetical protein [Vitreoscilla]AUZ06205.1 hypothetical protein ADP71_30050 [Vitreoscilla sp. C1]UOO92434.1 hypothetical protein LVJ81_12650 [Vitreoscilla stercoraria]